MPGVQPRCRPSHEAAGPLQAASEAAAPSTSSIAASHAACARMRRAGRSLPWRSAGTAASPMPPPSSEAASSVTATVRL